jgi:hypothetical protein
MKKILMYFSAIAIAITVACGGGKSDVNCCPEMKDFMSGITGTSASVEAALAKHGVEGLDNKDMGMYDLSEPTVVSCEKKEGKEWCVMEAKAGITVRTYALAWENGKITSVEDRGMK